MLSIDEVIARERNLAEIYRNDIVPKEDYHNMPWIDMENESNMRIAKEHEQLAEWLEELKALREEKSEFLILAKDNYEMGMEIGYNKAIDDMVGNLIANSRTEIIDGKLTLIVTEERIKTVANEMKRMESDCIDKLDTDENNEDIIYEMNCPKCNYDMFEIYDRVCKGGKSKYCKITNIHSSSCGYFYGTDWDVECTCPKCKTKFTFNDEDYETFKLKFNDGLSVKG